MYEFLRLLRPPRVHTRLNIEVTFIQFSSSTHLFPIAQYSLLSLIRSRWYLPTYSSRLNDMSMSFSPHYIPTPPPGHMYRDSEGYHPGHEQRRPLHFVTLIFCCRTSNTRISWTSLRCFDASASCTLSLSTAITRSCMNWRNILLWVLTKLTLQYNTTKQYYYCFAPNWDLSMSRAPCLPSAIHKIGKNLLRPPRSKSIASPYITFGTSPHFCSG